MNICSYDMRIPAGTCACPLGRRALEDLETLIPAIGLTSVDDVEALYETFYPGDELTARTATIIQAVLDQDAPKPAAPARPDLG
ncbi:hypothetical protein GCM10009543_30360 [Leifsonia naganoensis]